MQKLCIYYKIRLFFSFLLWTGTDSLQFQITTILQTKCILSAKIGNNTQARQQFPAASRTLEWIWTEITVTNGALTTRAALENWSAQTPIVVHQLSVRKKHNQLKHCLTDGLKLKQRSTCTRMVKRLFTRWTTTTMLKMLNWSHNSPKQTLFTKLCGLVATCHQTWCTAILQEQLNTQ